jgi:sialate O-acetylesterase
MIGKMRNIMLIVAALLLAGSCAPVQNEASESGLKMSRMYSDGMVLQRDIPLVIKGYANPGERVNVTLEGPFRTKSKKAKASSEGLWAVKLPALKAGTGLKLTVEAEGKTLVYDNVAAGEVWVCSGQSNMYFKVWESAESGEAEADEDLRLFNMEIPFHLSMVEWSDEHVELARNMDFYRPTQWQACDGENVRGFSAVAYNFGKMLREQLGVPVGLISNPIGGSPTEAWISRKDLEEGYPEVLEDWFNNPMVNQWCVEMGKINLGYPENNFANHPFAPACLFETGVATMEQFPIKGVIWYQGESNDFDIPMHEKLFGLLVDSWRRNWNNEQMPFHFVQLAGLHDRYNWPEFRDSQRKMADAMSYCDMAVSSDVADSLDIHPRQKKPVGERLARLSLCYDYGFDIVPCGPSIRRAVVEGDDVILEFDFAEGLKASDSQMLRCFEVAGADGGFVTASAVIADDKVVLSSDVESPEYVRYAWQPYTGANLVNGENLPASTFFITISEN